MTREFREFKKLLAANGYDLRHTRGSHFIYENADGTSISINKDLNRMVARRLISENGLDTKDSYFESK